MYTIVSMWEGNFQRVYMCPRGKPTIGVGYNLRRKEAKQLITSLGANYYDIRNGRSKLSKAQVDALYMHTFILSIERARSAVSNYDQLDIDIRGIFADMVYNMGLTKFKKFRRMIKAAESFDYIGIAREMKRSRWYRQTKRGKQYYRDVIQIAKEGKEVK